MPLERVNAFEIREINRKRIFQLLYSSQPLSKSEISRQLSISLPTVTQDIKELMQSDLIKQSDSQPSTGGRKAATFTSNPAARFSIGLDLTRKRVSVVVIDLMGGVIHSSVRAFPYRNNDAYFEAIGKLIDGIILELNLSRDRILGVGISVPAIVSMEGTEIVYSTVLSFEGRDISHFENAIHLPCLLCNDSNAGGAAELWINPDITNAVYVSVSSSVGGSFLVNHELFPGKNQRCSEIGHMTIFPDGKLCYCGKKGCLDAYCNTSILSSSSGDSLDSFFCLVRRGSPQHLAIWQEYLENLAIALNNLYLLFDCDIIVGGYLGTYISNYIDDLRALASSRNPFDSRTDYLQACHYKMDASAMGASLIFLKRFLKSLIPQF